MAAISRLAILGVGLIGGSLARALKQAGAVDHVCGFGRNIGELQKAQDLGVVDSFSTDLAEAVRGADLVVLAVPVGVFEALAARLKDCLGSDTILTDVGSTKESVIDAVRRGFGGQLPARFVPGHPIAGTEKRGVEASFPELYRDRRVILTPLPETDPQAVRTVQAMWTEAGAQVTTMEPHHHDEVLAATSHLPHVLAFALVDALSRMRDHNEIFQYAAGGFRDFTRIASSDPAMWHDICLANAEQIGKVMDLFLADLTRIRAAIADGDSDTIEQIFSRAKHARDHYCGHL